MSVKNHFENVQRCGWCNKLIFLKDKSSYEFDHNRFLCRDCLTASAGKIFKIDLEKKFKKKIEHLRANCGGDFNPEVFFWDTISNEEFISKEHANAYAKEKISTSDLNKIKIKEVYL